MGSPRAAKRHTRSAPTARRGSEKKGKESKSSNRRQIVRIARILTIFGSNESVFRNVCLVFKELRRNGDYNQNLPEKKKHLMSRVHDEELDRPAHQVAGRAAAGPTVSTPTTMIVAWTGGWSSIVSRRVVADVTLAGCCLQASRLFGTS